MKFSDRTVRLGESLVRGLGAKIKCCGAFGIRYNGFDGFIVLKGTEDRERRDVPINDGAGHAGRIEKKGHLLFQFEDVKKSLRLAVEKVGIVDFSTQND